jgi:hypothetical protein
MKSPLVPVFAEVNPNGFAESPPFAVPVDSLRGAPFYA